MANFDLIDFKGRGVSQAKKESGLNEYANSLFDASLTWEDVAWLKSVTKLPLVLKGILTGMQSTRASPCSDDGKLHCLLVTLNLSILMYTYKPDPL